MGFVGGGSVVVVVVVVVVVIAGCFTTDTLVLNVWSLCFMSHTTAQLIRSVPERVACALQSADTQQQISTLVTECLRARIIQPRREPVTL
jgi:hypothetical protein